MKTTISVPDHLFRSGGALAKRLKVSRSELYARALGEYLAKRPVGAEQERGAPWRLVQGGGAERHDHDGRLLPLELVHTQTIPVSAGTSSAPPFAITRCRNRFIPVIQRARPADHRDPRAAVCCSPARLDALACRSWRYVGLRVRGRQEAPMNFPPPGFIHPSPAGCVSAADTPPQRPERWCRVFNTVGELTTEIIDTLPMAYVAERGFL
jgi:hypothetical protein